MHTVYNWILSYLHTLLLVPYATCLSHLKPLSLLQFLLAGHLLQTLKAMKAWQGGRPRFDALGTTWAPLTPPVQSPGWKPLETNMYRSARFMSIIEHLSTVDFWITECRWNEGANVPNLLGWEAEHFWALQLLTKNCSQESQRRSAVSILVVSDMSVFLFAVTLERPSSSGGKNWFFQADTSPGN